MDKGYAWAGLTSFFTSPIIKFVCDFPDANKFHYFKTVFSFLKHEYLFVKTLVKLTTLITRTIQIILIQNQFTFTVNYDSGHYFCQYDFYFIYMIIFRCVRTSRHVYTMFDSTFTLLLCSIKMIMNDSTWLNWLKMVENGFTMVVYSYLAISAPLSPSPPDLCK